MDDCPIKWTTTSSWCFSMCWGIQGCSYNFYLIANRRETSSVISTKSISLLENLGRRISIDFPSVSGCCFAPKIFQLVKTFSLFGCIKLQRVELSGPVSFYFRNNMNTPAAQTEWDWNQLCSSLKQTHCYTDVCDQECVSAASVIPPSLHGDDGRITSLFLQRERGS